MPAAVQAGPVNSSGNFKKTVTMKKRTGFEAEYLGDDTHSESASAGRLVKVRAKTTVSLSGHYRRSGKYRLYHRGRNPHIKGTVAPNHYGYPLKFVGARASTHFDRADRTPYRPGGSAVTWVIHASVMSRRAAERYQ